MAGPCKHCWHDLARKCIGLTMENPAEFIGIKECCKCHISVAAVPARKETGDGT